MTQRPRRGADGAQLHERFLSGGRAGRRWVRRRRGGRRGRRAGRGRGPSPSSPTNACGMCMPRSGSSGIRLSLAVVDELLALGLLAQLLERSPLGVMLEPDPAVVVLADDQVDDLGGVGADEAARRRSRSGSAGGSGSAGRATSAELGEHVADDVAVERDRRRRRWSAARRRRPSSGTIRRNAAWPMVLPSWPTIAPSGVSNRSKPRPQRGAHQAEVGQVDLRAPASGAAVPGASTWVPSAAPPSVEVHRGRRPAGRAARIASIEPAGAFERASAQTGAGLVAGARLELDVADRGAEQDRLVRAGRRVGQARAARRGARAGTRRTASRAAPRPGGRARSSRRCCRRTARRAGTAAGRRAGTPRYFSTQSSPTPGVGEDVALEARRCG